LTGDIFKTDCKDRELFFISKRQRNIFSLFFSSFSLKLSFQLLTKQKIFNKKWAIEHMTLGML